MVSENAKIRRPLRAALGFGNGVDYEIEWDISILQKLVEEYDIHSNELVHGKKILTERDFVICILCHMRDGIGGEVFIDGAHVVDEFASRFPMKITLGGTNIRAAILLDQLGYGCSLHIVSQNDHVRRLMPKHCEYVCSDSGDSLYPHLIVQYHRNDAIKYGDIDIRTVRSNRIICHHDLANLEVKITDDFIKFLGEAKVLSISGFNAMKDPELMRDRVQQVKRMLKYLPKDSIIMYEDACYIDSRLPSIAHEELKGLIDIYSMNENELEGYLNRPISLTDPDDVLAALNEIGKFIISRNLVVHTQYWALALGEDAKRLAPALRRGITCASTRFLYGDRFGDKEFDYIKSLPYRPEGIAFCEKFNSMMDGKAVSQPVPNVEGDKTTTIGLGDTFVGGFISALL